MTAASSGDKILVGGGTYDEAFTMKLGVSLVAADFDPPSTTGSATIDGGASPAPVPTAPPPAPTKCKKHHKLKHGKCVKKKRHHR
jgi:hypothetical protein